MLEYPKFNFINLQKQHLIILLRNISNVINIKSKINIVEDPNDNHIIECAIDSTADYIILGDKHLLDIKKFKDVKIITARKLLEKYSKISG